MIVEVGDNVKLRDGRLVLVTAAASQDPDDYRWYAEDGETINAELPVETIFIGSCNGKSVVSDMSEVVSILNHTVL